MKARISPFRRPHHRHSLPAKTLVVILACLASTFPVNSKQPLMHPKEQTRLIYIFDALCGWCFGFSPVMARVAREYGDRVSIKVVSGGLRLGDQVGPIGQVAPYIRWAYKEVEKTCGVQFGEAFIKGPLASGDMVMNSLQPAIALSIINAHKPEHALAFAARLHHMIYVAGKAPEDVASYLPYVREVGYDPVAFSREMQEPEWKARAEADFSFAQQVGATGFPTLLLERDGRTQRLFSGYVPYERLKPVLDSLLAN